MVSAHTLKTFVKMHEYKFQAKVKELQANRLQTRLHKESKTESELPTGDELTMAEDWQVSRRRIGARNRPKSRYFDFILTANH